MFEEIYTELRLIHPADRLQIKRYIAWVGFRRRMHNEFYLQVHWVARALPLLSGEGREKVTTHWL